MSATAMDLLATKNASVVFTCSKDASVQEAAKLMSMRRVGALVVTDGGEKLQGIFSERDVMMRVVAEGRDAARTRVGEVMTTDVITISPETSIEDVEVIMRRHRVRHLPVLGERGLVGLVSIGDVLVYHAESRKQMVEQLTDYVSGGYRSNA
jgi:CBS domain-containing protein